MNQAHPNIPNGIHPVAYYMAKDMAEIARKYNFQVIEFERWVDARMRDQVFVDHETRNKNADMLNLLTSFLIMFREHVGAPTVGQAPKAVQPPVAVQPTGQSVGLPVPAQVPPVAADGSPLMWLMTPEGAIPVSVVPFRVVQHTMAPPCGPTAAPPSPPAGPSTAHAAIAAMTSAYVLPPGGYSSPSADGRDSGEVRPGVPMPTIVQHLPVST